MDFQHLNKEQIIHLLKNQELYHEEIQKKANSLRKDLFQNKLYIRGLIEISSFCKCNCYYCGLRAKNKNAERYRLSDEQILEACTIGYKLGFRTFVLQSGEDLKLSEDFITNIIKQIKVKFPDCAVTLSLGQRNEKTYQNWKNAGADRYLLRQEAASSSLFYKLHPLEETECKKSLALLKKCGYQTGSGFMVGSPFQTIEDIAEDILYLQSLKPEMIGIGPFIPHNQTPFAEYPAGSVKFTLFIISLLRLMFPNALIPATTALNTLSPTGHIDAILHGANVIMPNLTPSECRKKYSLYNGKKSTENEAAENIEQLKNEMKKIGIEIAIERGDYTDLNKLRLTKLSI